MSHSGTISMSPPCPQQPGVWGIPCHYLLCLHPPLGEPCYPPIGQGHEWYGLGEYVHCNKHHGHGHHHWHYQGHHHGFLYHHAHHGFVNMVNIARKQKDGTM
ncbi:hypothetical protein MHYP_G00065550 [Metynnis hypsauchen]